MQGLWIALLVLASPPAEDTPAAEGTPEAYVVPYENTPEMAASLRAAYDLKAAVRYALRREATTDGDEQRAATLELVSLYAVLQSDEKLAQDERLRLRTQVRSRLMKIAAQLRSELKREAAESKRLAKLKPEEAADDAPIFVAQLAKGGQPPQAATVDVDQRGTVLFQIGRGLGQGQGAGAAADDAGEALIELIKAATGNQKWDDQGGPGVIRLWRTGSLERPVRQAAQNVLALALGGRAVDDHGEELVELIETVIAPQSWEKNGGFGSIYYFGHLHVLVVRTTGEIHGNLGNALGNLRAAGN